jgi:hypothetical protein
VLPHTSLAAQHDAIVCNLRMLSSQLVAVCCRTPQGPATTVGQFVRSTLLFLAALLGVWYMASLALKKHKPLYHRNWM